MNISNIKFDILPPEILHLICKYIFPKDIYNFMQTNKKCYFSIKKLEKKLKDINSHIGQMCPTPTLEIIKLNVVSTIRTNMLNKNIVEHIWNTLKNIEQHTSKNSINRNMCKHCKKPLTNYEINIPCIRLKCLYISKITLYITICDNIFTLLSKNSILGIASRNKFIKSLKIYNKSINYFDIPKSKLNPSNDDNSLL